MCCQVSHMFCTFCSCCVRSTSMDIIDITERNIVAGCHGSYSLERGMRGYKSCEAPSTLPVQEMHAYAEKM